jgi:hypothetical protein
MLSINDNIKLLPNELQDNIYQYYWSYVYSNIVNELNEIIILDKQINIFVQRYENNIVKENNKFYYKKFNNLIKNITHNKGKILLCKYNNLSLQYCNMDYIYNICSNISNDYKYIAPILLCKSNTMRYQVIYYLKSL